MCDHLNEGGDQATLARLYQDCVESHQRLNSELDDLEQWIFDELDYEFDGDTYLEVVQAIVNHNIFLAAENRRLRWLMSHRVDGDHTLLDTYNAHDWDWIDEMIEEGQ